MDTSPHATGFRALWRLAVSPERGFRERASSGVRLGPSVGRMVLLRSPVAFLDFALMYWGFLGLYRRLADADGPVWTLVLRWSGPGLNPDDVRYILEGLPALPGVERALPWLLLAAPLYVLSLWIHDAFWDHGCLWMLGGLRERRGFRMTLTAEAEALQVGVIGAVLGLGSSLPAIGWILWLPLGIVGAYFWILRGVALAAFHGCPTWKGMVATILHAVLAACCVGTTLLLLVLVLARGLA